MIFHKFWKNKQKEFQFLKKKMRKNLENVFF